MPLNKPYEKKGILFKNRFKSEDKHPDYTGKATINDQEYQVAGWLNYREGKPPYITLVFNIDDVVIEEAPDEDSDAGLPDDVDDDLPF